MTINFKNYKSQVEENNTIQINELKLIKLHYHIIITSLINAQN